MIERKPTVTLSSTFISVHSRTSDVCQRQTSHIHVIKTLLHDIRGVLVNLLVVTDRYERYMTVGDSLTELNTKKRRHHCGRTTETAHLALFRHRYCPVGTSSPAPKSLVRQVGSLNTTMTFVLNSVFGVEDRGTFPDFDEQINEWQKCALRLAKNVRPGLANCATSHVYL